MSGRRRRHASLVATVSLVVACSGERAPADPVERTSVTSTGPTAEAVEADACEEREVIESDGPVVDLLSALFADTPIVAFGEHHGSRDEHRVIQALVCDRRFADVVDLVVVEFGNARLQDVVDRYVGGDDVDASRGSHEGSSGCATRWRCNVPDIVEALSDLRPALDWPDATSDLTDRAVAHIRSHPTRPRRARWPFVVLGVVIAAGVGVPVAAHLLASGGVRVEITGQGVPEGIATELDLGAPAVLRPNEARPPGLGDPSAAFAGRPRGAYTELWDEPGGGYVLITRFAGHVEDELIRKRVYDGGTLEEATVGGGVAYWVGGPHGFLYVDEAGNPAEDTLRLSAHALVWTRDGITYRLESTSRSLEESVALAESMD